MTMALPDSTSSATWAMSRAASAGASKRPSATKPARPSAPIPTWSCIRRLLYVGAQPERYVTRVGDDSVINIVAVDWESQPIADQDIEVQVVERRWTRTQEQDLATGRVKSTLGC